MSEKTHLDVTLMVQSIERLTKERDDAIAGLPLSVREIAGAEYEPQIAALQAANARLAEQLRLANIDAAGATANATDLERRLQATSAIGLECVGLTRERDEARAELTKYQDLVISEMNRFEAARLETELRLANQVRDARGELQASTAALIRARSGLLDWKRDQEENHPESVDGWKLLEDTDFEIDHARAKLEEWDRE